MSADIFISFASKDLKVAMTLCKALETRGFSCWISARNIEPGENFQVSIVRALRRARIMLLVFTANSNTSEEMTKELALASQQKIMVIPLRVEDVTPNDAFAYEFATRQWIDAFADWEVSLDQLSRRVAHALKAEESGAKVAPAVVAEADPPPAPAAEPEPPAAATIATAPERLHALHRGPAVEEAEGQAPEAAPAPLPPAPDVSAAPERRRRIGAPLAIAAGVAAAVALAATLFRPRADDGAAMAAIPPPRLSSALVVQPVAPAAEPPATPEAEPQLVKSANRPRANRQAAAAQPDTDIPY